MQTLKNDWFTDNVRLGPPSAWNSANGLPVDNCILGRVGLFSIASACTDS